MQEYNVEQVEKGTRIDKYVMDITGDSRAKIQKMLKADFILVNDKPVKNSYQVQLGDHIQIVGQLHQETEIKKEEMDLDNVYEDDDVLVINKPSGMVVHPALGHYSNTLVNGLLYYYSTLSSINGEMRPGIIHRLDKDTSGLLLVAKNDESHLILSKDLELRKISRTYTALVHGVIAHDTGTIDAPIGRDLFDRKKYTVTDLHAKHAVTHFKVLERYAETTLIECKLETGRTHQIRVHMQYIGHPIVNDPVYGKKKTINSYGQLLHASKLGFHHPKTGEYLEFTAELPDEFKELLKQFR